ncbi:MAG: hypothetical protein KVP17_002164 [Porospora cf. gigantea B]|uniref:uncharacterized protein n=1 Tax=Porospora cf. gigantea B TaxID=2853592 RepID=UPI0035717A7D|nr:MAG: hypothetical protein KVP17_002164 [Porospora cf. gigantea B]
MCSLMAETVFPRNQLSPHRVNRHSAYSVVFSSSRSRNEKNPMLQPDCLRGVIGRRPVRFRSRWCIAFTSEGGSVPKLIVTCDPSWLTALQAAA